MAASCHAPSSAWPIMIFQSLPSSFPGRLSTSRGTLSLPTSWHSAARPSEWRVTPWIPKVRVERARGGIRSRNG